jgi:ADP-ribosyl-[dinitrogen reductase] hydrolase
MYYAPDQAKVIHHSVQSSKTTHGTAECLDACGLFGRMLSIALEGGSKDEILFGPPLQIDSVKIAAIAAGGYLGKTREQIRGSGYVVESLEAALWCFQQSESYREAILLAANLGDDADTTAAVCGQVAGAFYGRSGIPASWLEKLARSGEIEKLALDLMAGK